MKPEIPHSNRKGVAPVAEQGLEIGLDMTPELPTREAAPATLAGPAILGLCEPRRLCARKVLSGRLPGGALYCVSQGIERVSRPVAADHRDLSIGILMPGSRQPQDASRIDARRVRSQRLRPLGERAHDGAPAW